MKVAFLVLALAAMLTAADKVDVTGKWTFQVETAAGSGSPNFVFKQDGEKLTGDYSGQLGTAKLEGTVKDKKIEFKFTVDLGGQSGTVVYAGTIEEDGTMKGTVKLAELGEGTWTGKRAK
jgi:hypothetical protein